jgi:predicted CoA-binding protein
MCSLKKKKKVFRLKKKKKMLRRGIYLAPAPWVFSSVRFSSSSSATERFQNPSDAEVQKVLKKLKTLVVVGLSNEKSKPSYHVAHEMLEREGQAEFPITLIPVRPLTEPGMKILGAEVKESLKHIDPKILQDESTLVDVFRKSSDIPPLMDVMIELGVKNVWLQQGVFDADACLKAKKKGMFVVADKCVFIEHSKLLPDQW